MQPAPSASVMKGGSCATRGCEPCQVGNQAALSGLSGVPQGCLPGADRTVNVCKGISKEGCMVLSDASKLLSNLWRLRLLFLPINSAEGRNIRGRL